MNPAALLVSSSGASHSCTFCSLFSIFEVSSNNLSIHDIMSLDLKSLGEKLKRCQNQLQLSTKEVSDGTGVDMSRVISIESGYIEPTGDEILIFADFFKQDYVFFISNQKLSASEQIDILYRKFGDEFSKQDRRIIQEFLYLCECEEFIWSELDIKALSFKYDPIGNYYKGHGEDGANSLRHFLGYKENDLIPNFYYELRKTGLHIFRKKLNNSNISGLFISHPYAGKCILINYDEDIFRQNFTLMHEVGHSIFDYSKKINISFQSDISASKYMEIRANSFASNFLIPKSLLKNLRINQFSNEIILKLCLQFKVNIQVLLISLKQSNLINQEQFDNFVSLRIPKSEKEDPELKNLSDKIKNAKKDLLEKGLSSFYVSKCYEAYQNGIITGRRLAEMFLTTEIELPKILENFSYKLNYGN